MYRVVTKYNKIIESPFVFPIEKATELADNMNQQHGYFHYLREDFDYAEIEVWQEDWKLDDVIYRIERLARASVNDGHDDDGGR